MNCKLILSANEIYKLFTIPSTYSELNHIIKTKLSQQTPYPFRLKYKDAEDELITLSSEEDLQTAVLTCQAEKINCLKIYVIKNEPADVVTNSQTKIRKSLTNQDNALEESTNNRMSASTPCFFENTLKNTKRSFQRGYTYVNPIQYYGGSESLENTLQGGKTYMCQVCGKEPCWSMLNCKTVSCEECQHKTEHFQYMGKIRMSQQKQGYNSISQTVEPEKGQERKNTPNRQGFQNITNVQRKTSSPGSEKKINYKADFVSKLEGETLDVVSGECYFYNFTITNPGNAQWPEVIQLLCVNGAHKGHKEQINSLKPGQKSKVVLELKAPKELGKYLSQWRLQCEDEGIMKGFGPTFFIETNVVEQKMKVKKENDECSKEQTYIEYNLTPKEELGSSKRALVLAESLNDMFPGDLNGKLKFVESCPSHYTIYDLVDKYLLTLRSKKATKPFGSKTIST